MTDRRQPELSVIPGGVADPRGAKREITIIDPTRWQGVPVPTRQWVVQDLIPAGTVSLLSGDGASGKTTLMVQLTVAASIGADWLGIPTRRSRALLLSAEDDAEELHRRVDAVRRHYAIEYRQLTDLSIVDLVGEDAVLGALSRTSGKIEPTELFEALTRSIESTKADLIVVDALADVFAGNEIDRQHARQFVGLLKRLARERSASVVIISHPSLTGLASGSGASGSTAWSNSVRSRLYFERVEGDPALRQLSLKKANYAAQDRIITVQYVDGAFALVDGGDPADRQARMAAVDDAFLELLAAHLDAGKPVSPNPSRSYAPKLFAEAGRPFGEREYVSAMRRLLDAGRIEIVEDGPPSKPVKRLRFVRDRGAP